MTADKVTVRCKACGGLISTKVRDGSTTCGHCRSSEWIPKNPVPADEGQDDADGRTGGTLAYPDQWEPAPIEPDGPDDADEECPDCGEPLAWEPAGTLLYCDTCDEPMFPPALVPQPGGRDDERRVTTQAERDEQALDLAETKGEVIDRIRRDLDDDRLTPGARGRLERYVTEIGAAETMARVAGLVEMLDNDKRARKRRGWFRLDAPNPAYAEVLDGEVVDDEDGDEWDDEDEQLVSGHLVEQPRAIAAPVPTVDYAAALAVRNYRIDPDAPDGRCVINERWHGSNERLDCQGGAFRTLGPLRLCHGHYAALTTPLSR